MGSAHTRPEQSACVSVAAALRANQGLYKQNKGAIMSQILAVRARVRVKESYREPERETGRDSKSQREPKRA